MRLGKSLSVLSWLLLLRLLSISAGILSTLLFFSYFMAALTFSPSTSDPYIALSVYLSLSICLCRCLSVYQSPSLSLCLSPSLLSPPPPPFPDYLAVICLCFCRVPLYYRGLLHPSVSNIIFSFSTLPSLYFLLFSLVFEIYFT